MRTHRFSDLTPATLKELVHLREQGVVPQLWETMNPPLTEEELQRLGVIRSQLLNYQLNLMNEATIWSRAIYPLLLLAEHGTLQAWAQVPLRAEYPRFILEGIVDGVLGDCVSGIVTAPYLIVAEAKRGLEAQNPQFQLYGEMLAAAWLNHQENGGAEQEIFGCYTIGDNWTFVRGRVTGFNETPAMTLETSREYTEKLEAETIFQILKSIAGKPHLTVGNTVERAASGLP